MIGGWLSYIRRAEKDMFGRQNDGSQTGEEYFSVMIVDIILEHKVLLPKKAGHCRSAFLLRC